MNKTIIFTDSCSSVPAEYSEVNNVYVIPTSFTYNDKVIDPLNAPFTIDEFYDSLEDYSNNVKTSCVTPQTFIDAFKPHLLNGDNILYVALSSGLSASYNNSLTAIDMLKDDFPKAQIEVIDTLTGSMGMMFAIRDAVKLRNEGFNPIEIKSQIDKNKEGVMAMFTIGSLNHLYKGGRLNLGVLTVGKILRLKPIVCTNDKGSLITHSIHLGKKKANNEMRDEVIKNINHDSHHIYIAYTNNLEEAMQLENELKEKLPEYKIRKGQIDYTMGCHCGPKTLAVFYRKNK